MAVVPQHERKAPVIVIRASLVLVVGITELAVALSSPAEIYAGSVLAILGFAPAFSTVFRSLSPLAYRCETDQKICRTTI